MQIERRTVRLRAIDVAVELHGGAAGATPVVLLPGGAVGARWYFPDLVERVAPTHTVVVHDRLGTASSPAPTEGVSLRSWAEDTIALLDALGIEQAALIGHSLGAALAALVLIERSERVRAALLLDTTPVNDADLCRAITKRSDIAATIARPVVVQRALTRLSRPRRLTPSARDAFERTMVGDWLGDTAAAARSLADDHLAVADRRPAHHVPTLLVTADRKPTHPMRRANERLSEQLGADIELWPGTGHSLHLQRPHLVVERLGRLLDTSFSSD